MACTWELMPLSQGKLPLKSIYKWFTACLSGTDGLIVLRVGLFFLYRKFMSPCAYFFSLCKLYTLVKIFKCIYYKQGFPEWHLRDHRHNLRLGCVHIGKGKWWIEVIIEIIRGKWPFSTTKGIAFSFGSEFSRLPVSLAFHSLLCLCKLFFDLNSFCFAGGGGGAGEEGRRRDGENSISFMGLGPHPVQGRIGSIANHSKSSPWSGN